METETPDDDPHEDPCWTPEEVDVAYKKEKDDSAKDSTKPR